MPVDHQARRSKTLSSVTDRRINGDSTVARPRLDLRPPHALEARNEIPARGNIELCSTTHSKARCMVE